MANNSLDPLDIVRITVTLLDTHGQIVQNTWFTQLVEDLGLPDADALTDMTAWMAYIYGFLDSFMDNEMQLADAVVDVVEKAGVYDPDPAINTAFVQTVRTVGNIFWTFTPAVSGEQYSSTVPAVMSMATGQPGTRGRKSISGFAESAVAQGLLMNSVVAGMASAAVGWLNGPTGTGGTYLWFPGVLSLKNGVFAPFKTPAVITNIPGTLVSRKIGRGA